MIKQPEEHGIQARSHFTAQLRVDLEIGVKTFPTLIEALPTLGELGTSVQVSERERMEQELSRESWQRQENGRRGGHKSLLDADLQAFMQDWVNS